MPKAPTTPYFNVLLVENNQDEARQIRLFLDESSDRNYRVTWERRLNSALDLLNSTSFDIVLLNLPLSDSQGIESIQRFSEQAPQTAIVAITEIEDEQLSVDAIRLGAQDYLFKKNLSSLQLDRVIGFAYERKNRQNQIRHEKSFLQTVIDSVMDPIMVLTPDREILMHNRAARESFHIHDRTPHKAMGHILPSCQQGGEGCPLEETLKGGKTTMEAQAIRNNNGDTRFFEVTVSPLKHCNGIETLVKIWRDITVRHQNEQQLKANQTHLTHLAHHDPLTGLPNRLFLFDRLQTSIEKARRQKVQVAVLFADLDHFKQVNDTLGHATGDLVLKETARRFQLAMRKSDTVSRLGGDEFVFIIEDPPALQDVIKVARKLVETISSPYLINGHNLKLTTSIGISVFPECSDRCDQLIEQADQAMFRAKSKGKNTFQFFEPTMEITAEKLGNIEDTLREALHADQFQLFYQPRFSLEKNRITGIEALLHWHHPTRGILTPEAFLPSVENGNLITELGVWIIRQALHTHSRWKSAQLRKIPLSINIAHRLIRCSDFAGIVKEALCQNSLPPYRLELEFSENDQLYASAPMAQLRRLGVGLAIDNFGTVPTSLSGLMQLPCTRLTIARSLIHGLRDGSEQLPLIKAAIAIGQSLNIPVVAKGVETPEQLQKLRELGCPQGQGFLFCPPLAENRLEISYPLHPPVLTSAYAAG